MRGGREGETWEVGRRERGRANVGEGGGRRVGGRKKRGGEGPEEGKGEGERRAEGGTEEEERFVIS